MGQRWSWMDSGTNPFWSGREGNKRSLQSLLPKPCWDSGSLWSLCTHTGREIEDRPRTGNPWGCQWPQGVSEPSSYSNHEFSPGSLGLCLGRPERLQGRAIPTSQGPIPVPHLVKSSELLLRQNLLFQPDMFLSCHRLS